MSSHISHPSARAWALGSALFVPWLVLVLFSCNQGPAARAPEAAETAVGCGDSVTVSDANCGNALCKTVCERGSQCSCTNAQPHCEIPPGLTGYRCVCLGCEPASTGGQGGSSGGGKDPCAGKPDGAVCDKTGRCCNHACLNPGRYTEESESCAGQCPTPKNQCDKMGKDCDRKSGKCVCPNGKEPCPNDKSSCCDKASPPKPTPFPACGNGGYDACAAMNGTCCVTDGTGPHCAMCPRDICKEGKFGDTYCMKHDNQCCGLNTSGGGVRFECYKCSKACPPDALRAAVAGANAGSACPADAGSPDSGAGTPAACYVDAPGNHSQAAVMDTCQNGHSPSGFDSCTSYLSSCSTLCKTKGLGAGQCVPSSCHGGAIPAVSSGGCGYPGYEDHPEWDVICRCASP